MAAEPDPGAEPIEAARRRLRAARQVLTGRPRARSLDSLCALLEQWRDASSRWRAALETRLPEATGYSRANVREGLARGLEHWTGEALRQLVRRELDPLESQRRGAVPPASGFELTSLLLAGSIPMPTLLSMLLPLVLHSPVLVKTASRDRVTAPLVAASLAELDPELGRAIEVVSFSPRDAEAMNAFLDAPCIVANGSDETVGEIASRLARRTPAARLVAYGHRLSLAVLGPEATRGQPLARAVEGLALDAALWDQLGCLSPVAVFVEDPDRGVAERVAAALAQALARAEERWPRGTIDTRTAANIQSQRAEAEMRRAAGREVTVHAGPGTGFTVVLEDDASLRPSPLHRFLRVHPAPDRQALLSALQPVAHHLAAVAIAGFGSSTHQLARELRQLGASRICRPGRLQSPPLRWNRNGQPLLLPLARLAQLDVD
jgi:hypothetical protein